MGVVAVNVGRTTNLFVVVEAGTKAKADSQAAAANSRLRVKCRLVIIMLQEIMLCGERRRRKVLTEKREQRWKGLCLFVLQR